MKRPLFLFGMLLLCLTVGHELHAKALPGASTILVEGESFSDLGGWMIDPQFMDQMGSPYLLAHGLGHPVKDATTTVIFPKSGVYKVLVRTKDWVAQWNVPGTPGRFQLVLDGKVLQTTFGTTNSQWFWQPGGTVNILEAGKRTIALHDLTGFEGRCDAILFTMDEAFEPPNAGAEMAEFRRRLLGLPRDPVNAGTYDLVVVGGGMAGSCAAVTAARLGLKVALIQDRPVLGGNNSSEVRVWLQGARTKEPWPRIGDVLAEFEQDRRAHYGPSNTAELYEDEKKLAVVKGERNIHLFIEHRANSVVTNDHGIRAVIAQEIKTGRRFQINGRYFADCTGDAVIGELAGADYDIQAEGRLGQCNLWNVCECKDTNALNVAVDESVEDSPFPRCPWALDLAAQPFPGRSKIKPDPLKLGGWNWESGFDRDPINEMEYIRDWNFRAMYGAWDAMKNVDHVLPKYKLNWAAYILGKRESRRLMGDVILTIDDLRQARKFPDACVPSGWKVDLHVSDQRYDKQFRGDGFIAVAKYETYPLPFWLPYRCLYSRNIPNLFMAGRDISVTHDALGGVRVMRTCGCMGEIVGMAASVCRKHDTSPRGVYEQHLSELQDIMRRGAGKKHATPDYENQGEPDKRKPVKKSQA
jgi:hypothetical protein